MSKNKTLGPKKFVWEQNEFWEKKKFCLDPLDLVWGSRNIPGVQPVDIPWMNTSVMTHQNATSIQKHQVSKSRTFKNIFKNIFKNSFKDSKMEFLRIKYGYMETNIKCLSFSGVSQNHWGMQKYNFRDPVQGLWNYLTWGHPWASLSSSEFISGGRNQLFVLPECILKNCTFSSQTFSDEMEMVMVNINESFQGDLEFLPWEREIVHISPNSLENSNIFNPYNQIIRSSLYKSKMLCHVTNILLGSFGPSSWPTFTFSCHYWWKYTFFHENPCFPQLISPKWLFSILIILIMKIIIFH